MGCICNGEIKELGDIIRNGTQLNGKILPKEHWTNLPIKDEENKSLILIAIEKNHLDSIMVLLSTGTDPNFYNQDLNVTPLIFATQKKNLEAMKLLVQYGADINFQTEKSLSPLHEACKEDFIEGVQYLLSLEKIAINAVESKKVKETPLFCAIEAGAVDIVKLLIHKGRVAISL